MYDMYKILRKSTLNFHWRQIGLAISSQHVTHVQDTSIFHFEFPLVHDRLTILKDVVDIPRNISKIYFDFPLAQA
jgi:hypothetical protein